MNSLKWLTILGIILEDEESKEQKILFQDKGSFAIVSSWGNRKRERLSSGSIVLLSFFFLRHTDVHAWLNLLVICHCV